MANTRRHDSTIIGRIPAVARGGSSGSSAPPTRRLSQLLWICRARARRSVPASTASQGDGMGRSIIRLDPLPDDRSCCPLTDRPKALRPNRQARPGSSECAAGYSRRDRSRSARHASHRRRRRRVDARGPREPLEQGGYEVVGRAGDGSELIRLVRECRPDLAVIDIRMPPDHRTEGLQAAHLIRKEFPQTAILLLSAHVEVTQAMTLLASGRGSGYLLKSRVTELDEFLDAVGRVSRGGSVVDPLLVQELVMAR